VFKLMKDHERGTSGNRCIEVQNKKANSPKISDYLV
jgi:hypothetical protein